MPARTERERGSDRPADKRRLHLVRTISGGMAPKSIVSDQHGRVFAMNMMYGHTITVFDRHYKRVKDIADSIDLSRYGYRGIPRTRAGRAGGGRRLTGRHARSTSPTTACTDRASSTPASTSAGRTTASTAASSTRSAPGRCARRPPSRSARCPSTWPSPPTAAPCSSATGAPGTSASSTCARAARWDASRPAWRRAASPSAPTAGRPT